MFIFMNLIHEYGVSKQHIKRIMSNLSKQWHSALLETSQKTESSTLAYTSRRIWRDVLKVLGCLAYSYLKITK